MNYNDTNTICSYFQNLLATTYTPTIRIIDNLDKAAIGEIFIYKNGVYKKVSENGVIKNNFICHYHTGERLYGITKNCITSSNTYSSDLHEALGDYLRLLRDQKHVDLMPLYNCFSNRYEGDFSLPIKFSAEGTDSDISLRSNLKTRTADPAKRVVVVPVKFEAGYHIYCKQPTSATIQLALYDKKDLITYNPFNTTDKAFFASCYSAFLENSLQVVSLNANSPTDIVVPILKNTNNKAYRTMQRCLYLFVELPAEFAEDLVIQEFLPVEGLLPEGGTPAGIISNNTLLQDDGKPAKPFSDKLLGYLLEFFISPLMPVAQSINRVQQDLDIITKELPNIENETPTYIGQHRFDYKKCSPGTLDDYTLSYIYNKYRESNIPDYIGYADRDVEYAILQELGNTLNNHSVGN